MGRRNRFVPTLPHAGGRVAMDKGAGRWVWRCSWCGIESSWTKGWAAYCTILDEDDGLHADQNNGKGWPVCCPKPECAAGVRKAVG